MFTYYFINLKAVMRSINRVIPSRELVVGANQQVMTVNSPRSLPCEKGTPMLQPAGLPFVIGDVPPT
jgi:hypothetical protein